MRTIFWTIWAIAVFTIGFVGGFAHASDTMPLTPKTSKELVALSIQKRTHPETILMAAYKLGHKEPDYQQWAAASPTVLKAADMDKSTVERAEMMRMKVGYDTLDIGQPLVVQTALSLDRYSTLTEEMQIPEFNSRTYFKYNMYGENVAFIARGITDYSRLRIEKAKLDKFLKATGGSRQLLGELLIRPRVADLNKPFVDNGVSYYLLMGDIAEVRVWGNGSDGPVLLWFDRADWYKPQDRTNLMDLKTGGM